MADRVVAVLMKVVGTLGLVLLAFLILGAVYGVLAKRYKWPL